MTVSLEDHRPAMAAWIILYLLQWKMNLWGVCILLASLQPYTA